MFKDNLVILRNIKGLSQEEVASVIGISRQSYSKWELGESVPDIIKCDKLAKFYKISIDSLLNDNNKVENIKLPPHPDGKHLFGTILVKDKGQIVIPKGARDIFNINVGDKLVVLGDESEGIALVKLELFEENMKKALELSRKKID